MFMDEDDSLGEEARMEQEWEAYFQYEKALRKAEYLCDLIDKGIWVNQQKEQIAIADMSVQHLSNAIAMLKCWLSDSHSDATYIFATHALRSLQAELDRRRQGFFTKLI